MEYIFYNNINDDIKNIRTKVFIEEQGFENEFDDIDDIAKHVLVFINNIPVGTGRLFSTEKNCYTIGRVAVLAEYRQHKVGAKIVEALELMAKELGAHKIILSAQCRVQGFYEKLGYLCEGDVYLDEHCEHIKMHKILL